MPFFLVLVVPTILMLQIMNGKNIGVRKDILTLTKDERETILQGLYSMKNTPSKHNSN